MGSIGSGRRPGYGRMGFVSNYLSLDVNELNRKSVLRHSQVATISWGESDNSIKIRMKDAYLVLEYNRTIRGESEDIYEQVQLEWTDCHFGGQRRWFLCPGIKYEDHCGKRVRKLYVAGKYFVCRHCYELVYPSQYETYHDRMMRKARNIRLRLGGSLSLTEPFPKKPKGMHWKTYFRLKDESDMAASAMLGKYQKWMDLMERKLG